MNSILQVRLGATFVALLTGCTAAGPTTGPVRAPSPASPSFDVAGILARYKSVTGGPRWDAVGGIETDGAVATGGLTGTLSSLQDARTGRTATHYTLGPVNGASGFDGKTGWEQDPGGEVRTLDAAAAREISRTDAWMTALGYWYPDRGAATFAAAESRDDGGRHYHVIKASPQGGRPIELWFDDSTGLLARTEERHEADVVVSILADYRTVDGVRLPFQLSSDSIDAAGRIDPREHREIRIDKATLEAHVDDSAFAAPTMEATARIDSPSGTTRVPFDLVNNHIYAKGSIDGKPVRVLVDTGGANVLTPAAASQLGLATQGNIAGRGVGDEHVDVSLARPGEVRLGDAVLSHPVFFVMDLGSLPSQEGLPSEGLVGFEMFRRFRVTVDYAARVLTLTDPAKFTPPVNAHVVPFELAERIPVVTGTLDGLPVRLSIDTGSRASLSMHSTFVREHDLVTRYGAAAETVVGWGVGGAARGRPARLGTLTLGDVTVHDIAGDLYAGDKGAFANPDLAGNLGGGVLSRFAVTFDYDAKKMYLVPNADFQRPDAFDRSGMWLFLDGDGLQVAALTPGGPAAKAGVAEGDRIVRLGGQLASARPLAEWRARLRELPAGTRLDVVLQRAGGVPRTLHLVLADIIPPHWP